MKPAPGQQAQTKQTGLGSYMRPDIFFFFFGGAGGAVAAAAASSATGRKPL